MTGVNFFFVSKKITALSFASWQIDQMSFSDIKPLS
jgi:hypothetical protein